MSKDRRRKFSAFMALILSFLLVALIPFDVSSVNSTSGEDPFDDILPMEDDSDLLGGDQGQAREEKEIPMLINSVQIFGHERMTAYPNIPFVVRITYTAISPDTLKVFMDMNDPEFYIEYKIRTNEFGLTDRASDMIDLDQNLSGTIFNTSKGKWETDLHLRFKWTMEEDRFCDMEVILRSETEGSYSYDIKDAYILENDILVSGEPRITVEDPEYMTPDGYLKGGVFIMMSEVSVTFQGTDSVSPEPGDLKMGIRDSHGTIWNIEPHSRKDMTNIHFSFRTPVKEGTDTFKFQVFDSPPNSLVKGEGVFSFILDSSYPVVGDLRNDFEDGSLGIDMKVEDEGSGADISSLMARLLYRDGEVIMDWFHPDDLIIDRNRIRFDMEDVPREDLQLEISLKDRVGNTRTQPKVFFMSTLPETRHDLSVSKDIQISMDPIIEGYGVQFTTYVSNRGTVDEEDVMVDILLDNSLYRRIGIGSLKEGSNRKLTWTWKAQKEGSIFTVRADPAGLIDDIFPDDNVANIMIDPHYRDLTARSDYILPSDWNAEAGEVVVLSLMLMNTGSISTPEFNVQVKEEETFLGQYVIGGMEADSSMELVIDWIVDPELEYITVIVDPFNEIPESVESNNRIELPNPLYDRDAKEHDLDVEETGEETDEREDIVSDDEPDEEDEDKGGTVWKGPEEEEDSIIPLIPSGDESINNEPPSTGGGPAPEIPMIVPSIIVTLTLLGVAGSLLAFRIEPVRYRWTLMLIPLYSKLKKSKIEKGVRFEILGYIKARPGANYSELKRNLDLNDGSLVHHLRVLEREEKVYSKKMGKYKLFYASSYKRRSTIEEYVSPFHQRILQIISENPGIVPKKLSVMLDRSQTDISYHLSELSRNGYLERIKEGRNSHYYINKELLEILSA